MEGDARSGVRGVGFDFWPQSLRRSSDNRIEETKSLRDAKKLRQGQVNTRKRKPRDVRSINAKTGRGTRLSRRKMNRG
jgi:hypothetical protein